MLRYRRGLTLVELLIALLLLALMLRLGLPSFNALVSKERSVAALNHIIGAVNLARASAATQNRAMVLCPAPSNTPDPQCGARNSWHLGAMVFADSDADGSLDAGEAVIRRIPGWTNDARITWRSFRNRSYLRFRPNGMTDWQNGSFTWCPADGDLHRAVQVVLNAGGRARTARDLDGDGIAEDSSGKPLRC